MIVAVALAPFLPKPGGCPFGLARGHFGGGRCGAFGRLAWCGGARGERASLRHCGRGRCGGLLHAVGGADVRGKFRKEGAVSASGGLRRGCAPLFKRAHCANACHALAGAARAAGPLLHLYIKPRIEQALGWQGVEAEHLIRAHAESLR